MIIQPIRYWQFVFAIILFSANAVKVYPQDLASYLEIAEENNTAIQAFDLNYEIAKEKINEVGGLPDTEISAAYFVSTPETRVGSQRARFSVKQMIPWFGTIAARENYQNALANTEYVNYVIAKRKLRLEVAQKYYELYQIQATKKIVNESLDLLSKYEELALNAVEVGTASAVDFLKIQIRQNDLHAQLALLDEDLKAAKIQFNALLNIEVESAVQVADSLYLPEEDFESTITDISSNYEIINYDKLAERIVQEELLNQRDAAPKIGLGLDYLPVSERTDMVVENNGKDIIMPMISVSVPLFTSKYKSISRQNEIKQATINAQKSDRLNLLKGMYADAIRIRNSARIDFLKEAENLKQARNAEEILLKNYETGTIDFNEILDIQELQLRFNRNQVDAIMRYYKQVAIINYLTSK
nr:heavy metal RND efflux outer membrane protein, CzcC family [uncultured bacterium]